MPLLPEGSWSLLVHHAARWFRNSRKVLHQLWLEVTGAVFLGMAVFAAPSIVREWRAYQEGGSLWRPGAVAVFLVMMIGFGVYSFRKARRIR